MLAYDLLNFQYNNGFHYLFIEGEIQIGYINWIDTYLSRLRWGNGMLYHRKPSPSGHNRHWSS